MVFDRANSLGYLAGRLGRQLAAMLQQDLEPLGVTPGQFAVLLELDGDDGLTQAQLSSRLRVEQSSMAQTVARLRRDEFVRQAAHEDDRRASRLWLTDAARQVLGPAIEAAVRVNDRTLGVLGPAEAERFLRTLRRLVDHVPSETPLQPPPAADQSRSRKS